MIESVLTYNIVSWYGNLTVKQKNKLTLVINEANKRLRRVWDLFLRMKIKGDEVSGMCCVCKAGFISSF